MQIAIMVCERHPSGGVTCAQSFAGKESGKRNGRIG